MYSDGAIFHLALLHLGQNRGPPPRHQNLPEKQIKTFCIQEAIFWKEWT